MALLNRNLRIVVKTGKITVGKKNIMSTLRTSQAKLLIMADNIPEDYRETLLHHISLQNRKIDVFTYPGGSWALGNQAGRPHMVGAMLIEQPGDSKILKVVKEF